MFITTLVEKLSEYHLLKHRFYKSWNEGALSTLALQHYACQYYPHVDAFPRYISAIHTQCPDLKSRQVLLGNLVDEESGDENHPELWLRFAESMGASRDEAKQGLQNPETRELVEGFFALSNKSYAEGLGALFAYEQQVPEVASTKIAGLKKFYGYDDANPGLKFFDVHMKADVWHSEECANLLQSLPPEEQQKAEIAAIQAAKLLNNFLDGVCTKMGIC